jgi:hypothetical protein
MPLFEVETESHIIITWAEDQNAANGVVHDAYPHERVVRLTKRSARRQGPRHSTLYARNRFRSRTSTQSHRIKYGDGLVKPLNGPSVQQ